MSRRKNYRLRAAATACAAKARRKKTSPNVSNNLDVEPEVTEYTSSQAMQETSRTNQPRTPDGEECIAVSDSAVSNLLQHLSLTVTVTVTVTLSRAQALIPSPSLTWILKSWTWKEKSMPTSYEKIQDGAAQRWAKAEKNRNLGYNGLSARTRRRQEQKARSKDKSDAQRMNSKGAAMMHSFFISGPTQSKLSQPDAATSGSAPHKCLPTMPMAASQMTVVQSGSLIFSQTSKHRSHWCAK